MTIKTLAEAAAEVLNASRAKGLKEPMHHLDNTGSGLDNVQDIGGSTIKDVQGGDVGSKAAAGTPSATAPGTQPDSGTKEPMHKLKNTGGQEKAEGSPGDVELDDAEKDGKIKEKAPVFHEEEEYTDEELEQIRQERWNEIREKMKAQPVSEDINALFSGESLSEEFKTKAATIFEAAVLTRAIAVAEEMEKEILASAEEAIEETRTELEEQIEGYLNFVVENWVKENEIAIESGLKAEIVEDFIVGLKNLFAENYVDLPEDKIDVVEAQAEQIQELTDQVNEVLNANIELNKKLNEGMKKEILNSVCEGLTATQAEKVKTLAEGVEFTTDGEYTKKLEIIRDSYASSKVKDGGTVVSLIESTGPAEVVEETLDPRMAAYTRALKTQS